MSDAAAITVFTHDFQADVCNFRSEDIELLVSVRLSPGQLHKCVGNMLYCVVLNALKGPLIQFIKPFLNIADRVRNTRPLVRFKQAMSTHVSCANDQILTSYVLSPSGGSSGVAFT